MTQPLALIFYQRIMPGSQVLNRLQDLGYRVQHISDPQILSECAEREKPLLLIVDLDSSDQNICDIIARLKRNEATRHLPVISFAADEKTGLQAAALQSGSNLAVGETAIANHLPQLLDRALQIE
jgi:PleD family two-component response regulator